MRHIILHMAAMAALSFPAHAEVGDAARSDNRIRVFQYSPDDVYTINTLYGYQTNIELATGEDIQTISVGDRGPWQLISEGNRLFIRPAVDGVSTNMSLITNKRTYQFDLKSGKGAREKNADLMYVVRFTYPDDKPVVKQVFPEYLTSPSVATVPIQQKTLEQKYESPEPRADAGYEQSRIAHYNYLYSYSGADALAPEQVYDDGSNTYIRFADMTRPLPKVYVPDSNGQDVQVPVTLNNGFIKINVVSSRIALVSGEGTIQVYNETLSSGS